MKKIFLFNPTCELAVENGQRFYTPPHSIAQFEKDLCVLPLAFSCIDDVILSSFPLSNAERIYFDWLFAKKGSVVCRSANLDISLQSIYFPTPWGYSPNIYPILNHFSPLISSDYADSAFGTWHPRNRDFFSRLTAIKLLEISPELLSYLSFNPVFLPQIVDSFEMLDAIVNSEDEYVVKCLWSSAGRGVFISEDGRLSSNHINMLTKIFKQKGRAVVEPYFDKVVDFSMQFEIDGLLNVSFTGISLFDTNEDGKYLGSKINFTIADFIKEFPDLFKQISLFEVANLLTKSLHRLIADTTSSPFTKGSLPIDFIFPFGVDMMVYRDVNNEFRLHPCIEINWRYTMGYVANKLSELIDNNFVGHFEIGYFDDWKERCESRINELDFKQSSFNSAGFYPVTSWANGEKYGAFVKMIVR